MSTGKKIQNAIGKEINLAGRDNNITEIYTGININAQNVYLNVYKDDITANFVITKHTDITPTFNFIGREQELNNLREYVNAGKFVLIDGIGGVGKTHLCRYLYQEYLKAHAKGEIVNIDHIGYLNYYESMDDTLLNGLRFNTTNNYENDVRIAWDTLITLSMNKRLLIIIDNLSKAPYDDKSISKLYSISGAVFLTSRMRFIDRFETYDINVLPYEECKKLFEGIYGNISSNEQTDIKRVVNIICARHTKTVELLAYMAKSKNWKINDLRSNLEEKKFDLSYISNGEKTNLQNEYEKLFDLARLSKGEVNVLEAFCLFSPSSLPINICNEWMNADAHLYNEDEVINTLHLKGWLEKSVNSYFLHPVIAEVIFAKQHPQASLHLELLEACTTSITLYNNEEYLSILTIIPHAEAIAHKLWDDTMQIFGSLSYRLGYLKYYKGEYDKALEWYQKARAVREKVLGIRHPNTASTYASIAKVFDMKNEYTKALVWYEKALAINLEVLGKDHINTAAIYNNMGLAYHMLDKYDEAMVLYGRYLDIIIKINGEEHHDVATAYNNIALVYNSKGEYDNALEWYHKAIAISERVCGKEHPDNVSLYANIAVAYKNKGKYDEALQYFNVALSIMEKMVGEEHPSTTRIYIFIASIYEIQGKYMTALEWIMKALYINEKILGKEHFDTATTYEMVGEINYDIGKYDEALKWYRKALFIEEKVLGKGHSYTAKTYNSIGLVFYMKREYANALEWHIKASLIVEKVLGMDHPNAAIDYYHIARVYYRMSEYGIALDWYVKAYSILIRKLGSQHPTSKIVYTNMYATYIEAGKKETHFAIWLENCLNQVQANRLLTNS